MCGDSTSETDFEKLMNGHKADITFTSPPYNAGTTLIACEQLNRKCYMMEYEPRYIDVIIDRWETLTGEKAVLLNVEVA